ncbi:MAG: hypothetical protein R3D58_02560 [Saprospiraceae bacterium]
MDQKFIDSLCRRSGVPELFTTLTDRLSASELNSLLLEVYRVQTERISPAQLLAAYRQNRFAGPASVDALSFRRLELQCLNLAESLGFMPLELSPVSPLGTCSAIGTVHQHKVLSASRGTEVTADATNVMALESSLQRRQSGFPTTTLHLSCAHRHLRSQRFDLPGFTPHFGIFCLTSAGRDTGDFYFEKENLAHHIGLYYRLLSELLPKSTVKIVLKNLNQRPDDQRLSDTLARALRSIFPETPLETIQLPEDSQRYYRGLQFGMTLETPGGSYPIIDGGFTNWTQQLCNNRKERFLGSGLGLEFLWKILNGQV